MTGEYLLRLGLAAAVGIAIGAEREFRDKAAGLRTIILISIGACLFTIYGAELSRETTDPTRIPAGVVSGVGFLGAGVIFRRGRQSTGITTAASIWTAAALGMGIGGGLYAVSLAAAGAVLIVLWVLLPVERVIDNVQEVKIYELKTNLDTVSIGEIHDVFTDAGLKVVNCTHGKQDRVLDSEFEVLGSHEQHSGMVHALVEASWVSSLKT